MTESLLHLDGIARSFRQTQSNSIGSFRALHASVRDISARSSKIREATRSHLRALNNVTRTEHELHAAVQSYTIPEWLARVGESCSKHSKGDVACSTAELCRAMQRLVVSKAYLDSKPWNPVAAALQATVDRYVKSIVAAAEDRVLLRFMQARSNSGSSSGGSAAPAALDGTSMGTRSLSGTSDLAAATSTGSDSTIIFGNPGSASVEMSEATELLTSLFKNYCRIRSVQEVKAFTLDQIHAVLESKRAEFRRLRSETGGEDLAGGGGNGSSFSFFGSSQMLGSAPERLGSALRDLIASCHRSSSSSGSAFAEAFSIGSGKGGGGSSGPNSFFGSRDDADCVFGLSVAARSLCLDVSAFLDRYVLSAVPAPPKRRTATEALLLQQQDETGNDDNNNNNNNNNAKQQQQQPSQGNASEIFGDGDGGENDKDDDDSDPPLDSEAADEIDQLRAALLTVPAEIVEMTACYTLDLLAKLITDIAVKQPYALQAVPITMLEAVQEAWHWRHTCRMVCGDTSSLRVLVDDKVDAVLQLVFDNFANMRDEPGNLTAQTFLDLALGDDTLTFSYLPFDLLFVSGVQAYADKNMKVLDERVGQKFRRAVWHPERDSSFGFAPALIDALRRMVSAHESTLHVVFAGSVTRVDTLIQKADAAISVQESKLVKEARRTAARRRQSNSSPQLQNDNNNNSNGANSSSSHPHQRTTQSDFASLTARAAIDAESAARDVFEFVRSDIEDFFLRTIRSHITWASAAATAAFLLHHASFQEDEDGEMTSTCLDSEEELLLTKVAPGKLRFHPALFRANTIQKIMNRLSSSGVFDVDPGQQLVWKTTQQQQQHRRASSIFGGGASMSPTQQASIFNSGGPIAAASPAAASPASGADPSIFSPTSGVVSMFEQPAPTFSPQNESPRASSVPSYPPPSAAATSVTDMFESPSTSPGFGYDFGSDPQPAAAAAASSKPARAASSSSSSVSSTVIPWRQKLLDTLLRECSDLLAQEIELVASRWATILPQPSGPAWAEMAESPATEPLTHSQRAAAKNWFWEATSALYDELELWEGGGVVAVEDTGLRAALGEASVAMLREVLHDVENVKLKGREWSTRAHRWFKIPRQGLEQAVRSFQLPSSDNE